MNTSTDWYDDYLLNCGLCSLPILYSIVALLLWVVGWATFGAVLPWVVMMIFLWVMHFILIDGYGFLMGMGDDERRDDGQQPKYPTQVLDDMRRDAKNSY